ncbi:alpha-1B adrenergic receptor isoform X3 [Patagioenas fasciata]|uniref:alpha-1B adrenergic receptor isoform X3 n=1 Tax=Patagioenas fasciata TaxID=372321 RepID=UPI003A9A2063
MNTYLGDKSNLSIPGYLKLSALNNGNLSANSSNETASNLDSPALDISRAIIVGLILGAFILFAIVGNILVILSVACNRHLRIPTNYFIINLAIADLLLSFTVLPFSATLEVLGYWVLGRIFCDIWAAVDVLCCTASILSLCAISIDRYIGVRYSLQYPTLVTRRRAILALLGVWVLSMVISIGPLLGWKEPAPKDDKECRITEEPFYALFSSLGSFYIPLIVILVMYCRVYIVAKRTTKNLEAGVMKGMSNSKELTLRIHYKNIHEDTLNSTKSKGHNPRNSLAFKLFKFSREKKAAKTLGIVVGMFILCWLPFFIVLPLGGGRNSAISSSRHPRLQQNQSGSCRGSGGSWPGQRSRLLPSTGTGSRSPQHKFNQVTLHRKAEFHQKTNFLQSNTHFCKSCLLETGFDAVEGSCFSCFRTHLLSFCVLQCFSSLQ